MITDLWHRPATIERNNFKFKSLSCWSYNIAVGCEHACRFCYVPEVSAIRMSSALAARGVNDPDAEWGEYVFLRQWNEKQFLNSLRAAMTWKARDLNADGNRAVMLCTTTDAYQVIRNASSERQRELQNHLQHKLVSRALELILHHSDLNVRILTRSPLARRDFGLMALFGKRLLFGMSLPTLNNRLAKIYEPKAPAPSQRLETLKRAKAAGLNVFVAVAPVYPECDAEDLRRTLEAVKELDPVTIFMEPINIRADNVARIEAHAQQLGEALRTEVFQTPESWRSYAMDQMLTFARLCEQRNLLDRMHLWPDASLGSPNSVAQFKSEGFDDFLPWLQSHWNKTSAWPK